MLKRLSLVLATVAVAGLTASAQTKLSTKWEELTAADFRDAISKSKGACILPFGILEKHGPHLPLGTDLLNVRYASLHAAATGRHHAPAPSGVRSTSTCGS